MSNNLPSPGQPEPQHEKHTPPIVTTPNPLAKSRIAAGVFGIVLGGLGVHRFYLGYTAIGIAQILVTLVTCGLGWIWGLIEGILLLTKSPYFQTDAFGHPFREDFTLNT